MSTHGCLLIKDYDDRELMLHTSQSGMDIPKAVIGAFNVLVEYWLPVLEDRATNRYKSQDMIRSINMLDRLEHAETAAGLIIAARPALLSPVYYPDDLATWSGADKPFKLKITKTHWKLTSEDGAEILSRGIASTFLDAICARMLLR